MFGKITFFWNLFRQGEAVANPAAWHDAYAQAQRITAFIVLAISGCHAFGVQTIFGVSIDIPPKLAFQIGLAIAGVGAWLTNQITSPHAGFLPARPAATGESNAAGNALRIESAPEALPDPASAAETGLQFEGDSPGDVAKKQAEQIFSERG